MWTEARHHLIFVKPLGVTPLISTTAGCKQETFCEFFFVMVQTRLLHNVQISKYTYHFWIPVIQTLSIYICHSINFIQLSLSLKMAHKWEGVSLICHKLKMCDLSGETFKGFEVL
jgi:hypothetical protein